MNPSQKGRRAQRLAEIRSLLNSGLTSREAAQRLGLAYSTVRAYLNDPDGKKMAARRRGYGMPCLRCGKLTDGSNGPAAAPRFCDACTRESRAASHGTYSKARGGGCKCAKCRRANAEYQRDYMWRTGRTSRKYPVPYRPRTGRCAGCGCAYDEQTPGCRNCVNRHYKRRKSAA